MVTIMVPWPPPGATSAARLVWVPIDMQGIMLQENAVSVKPAMLV